MKEPYPLKIDCYSHIIPPRYGKEIAERFPAIFNQQILPCPTLYDLDARFRVMDRYEPLRQVLTLGRVPTEHLAGPKEAAELARIANDEMAELVSRHRDRFCGALATVSMTDMDEALKETDRCIKDLRFNGVYIHTPVDERPLDDVGVLQDARHVLPVALLAG